MEEKNETRHGQRGRLDTVLKFAKRHGYQSVSFRGHWKNFAVYEMLFSDDHDTLFVGLPQFILDDGKTLEIAGQGEAFDVLDSLDREER